MVRYEEIEGNLLELHEQKKFDMIGHGCNCFNQMGGGIAKQIADKYPEAYYTDKFYWLNGFDKLGNYSIDHRDGIFNIYSQFAPGENLDYEALTLALRKINYLYQDNHIGLPQIGCGIGGGIWDYTKLPRTTQKENNIFEKFIFGQRNDVKTIIREELKDMYVTVVIYKK